MRVEDNSEKDKTYLKHYRKLLVLIFSINRLSISQNMTTESNRVSHKLPKLSQMKK